MIKRDSNINSFLKKVIIIILIVIGTLIYPITKVSQAIQYNNKEIIKYCTLLNGKIITNGFVECNLNGFPIGSSIYYMKEKFKLKEYCKKNNGEIINGEYTHWSLTQTLDDVFYCKLNGNKIYEIPK